MSTRIGIIGAGAIGCVVGGFLTKAGHDVTLIDQWPEHVEAMKKNGLRLGGTCGEHTAILGPNGAGKSLLIGLLTHVERPLARADGDAPVRVFGRDDWDIMFMDEYKNWAAFDGINAKYDAIMGKLVGAEDKQVQLMTKRTEVREILGDKVMQELIIK